MIDMHHYEIVLHQRKIYKFATMIDLHIFLLEAHDNCLGVNWTK